MLNNYGETLSALNAFVILNAPAGAERELQRLDVMEPCDYINLEFRPSQDIGCQLYIRTEGPEGRYGNTRIEDADGNLWYAYRVKCEVSWSSWGASPIEVTQRRLALMTEVTRFACEVERAFPDIFHQLSQTSAERDAQAVRNAKSRAIAAVESAVLANAKGMKVGQTKSVVVGTDVSPVDSEVLVERKEGGRTFKYSASVEHGFRTGERGLVYFMRLEA